VRALDLITKKRSGEFHTRAELGFLINGYVAGEIPEYQISAWLMAVFFQGMTPGETKDLTEIMIESGEVIELTGVKGPFVDKHSTGGVGDKVSLILAPMVAACGVPIPMMSGRSLGHTGGTLDKLESIPGYSTALSPERFREIIGRVGFAMTGQSKAIVPADRLLYALRDTTATVESVPLITGSILSKKFAEGSDALIFDVKTGPGAFMKTPEEARALATSLTATGKELGKKIVAVLTRMEEPLGTAVGNFLEVEETLSCLKPNSDAWKKVSKPDGSLGFKGPSAQLMEVTLRLGGWMLVAGEKSTTIDEGIERCVQALESGDALKRFEENVVLQGGDLEELYRRVGKWRAPVMVEVIAPSDGWIGSIDAYSVGMAGVYLGAGRSKNTDPVHPHVGIEVLHRVGNRVRKGNVLFRLWATREQEAKQAQSLLATCFTIATQEVPEVASMILEEIAAL